MFKDLAKKLLSINCFKEKLIYSVDSEILELAQMYDLIGIKEEIKEPTKPFDQILTDFNDIAINKYNAEQTVISFLDLVLISPKNINEIHSLLQCNQVVVCPAIVSAGISILGRNPPDIISTDCFSDPVNPSFISLINEAEQKGIEKVAIYDSFRAGYDVDIKFDLIMVQEYLKIFDMTESETHKFLKNNLNLCLEKVGLENNRKLRIKRKSK